jgi:superfamily II DNA or RNA helicase
VKPDPRQQYLFKPEGLLRLRPYQQEAKDAVLADLKRMQATMFVAPTGSGKTVTFAELAREHDGAIVVADRDALITQAAWKLSAATGKQIAIEKAERKAFGSRYICASIQSCRGKRLTEFAARYQDIPLIIVDEGDLAVAPTYRKFRAAFPRAKFVYTTATPDRADGIGVAKNLTNGHVSHVYDVVQAVEDGWLTPIHSYPVELDVDLDKIRTIGRDLDPMQLDDAIAPEAAKIARSILDHAHGRLIVFTPGVKTAHVTAGALNQLRPGCAAAIDGHMDDDDVNRILDAHEAGEIQYVANCNMLTRGYDDPRLSGMFDAAPTESRTRYAQRMGRPMRIWPEGIDDKPTPTERITAIAASPKPVAWAFDLACNGDRHHLVTSVDLFGGRYTPDERKVARDVLKKAPGSVVAALEDARSRIQETHAARAAAAVRARLGKVRTVFEMVGLGADRARIRLAPRPEDMATPRQLGLLKYKGIPVPPACTKREFKRLIGTQKALEDKRRAGLGTVEWLAKMGVAAQQVTHAEALRLFRAYVDAGSRRLTQDEVLRALAPA